MMPRRALCFSDLDLDLIYELDLCIPKMNHLGQSLQKLEHHGQTDARTNATKTLPQHAAFAGGKIEKENLFVR